MHKNNYAHGSAKVTMSVQISRNHIFGNIFSFKCNIPLLQIAEECPLNSALVVAKHFIVLA